MNKKYKADTFIIAIRKNGGIYACEVEDFADIVTLVTNKDSRFIASKKVFGIIEAYARKVTFIDTVADFERKAIRWNKKHGYERFRGYYFEMRVCRVLKAKRNPVINTAHKNGYDAILDGEGVEIKYLRADY